jgi:hypothetical protein
VADWQSFFLIARCSEEIDKRKPLAILVTVNQSFIRKNGRRGDTTRGITNLFAQIGAIEVFADALEREEVKCPVLTEWPTDCCSVLLAMEAFKWSAVGSVCS